MLDKFSSTRYNEQREAKGKREDIREKIGAWVVLIFFCLITIILFIIACVFIFKTFTFELSFLNENKTTNFFNPFLTIPSLVLILLSGLIIIYIYHHLIKNEQETVHRNSDQKKDLDTKCKEYLKYIGFAAIGTVVFDGSLYLLKPLLKIPIYNKYGENSVATIDSKYSNRNS